MSDNIVGIVGATLTAGERLSGSMGVGRFVVNDYVITLAEAPEGEGYTLTIARGSQVQTATLRGMTPEQYEAVMAMLAQALREARSAGEAALGAYPTNAVSGAAVSFPDGADDLPVKALTVYLMPIQAGSGDPGPSNVRPLTGRTGATVTRLGKNLANIADNSYTSSGVVFTVSGGAVRMTGRSTGTINRTIGTVRLSAGVTYAISGSRSSGIANKDILRIDLRAAGGSVIASGDSYSGFAYTPAADVTAQVNIRLASGRTIDATLYPQVEAGRTATDFEPYAPTSWAVDWSGEAGTVYGGALDVTRGLLSVCPYYAAYAGEPLAGPWVSSRDVYAPGTTPTAGAQVVDLGGATTDYQLSPVEVLTLMGANTFSADAGDLSLIYRADPTLFAARGQTEDDMTADAPIASGAYFQIGSTLYRAAAAIATGETIVPGGNCAATGIAEALNLLNA